MKRKRLEIKEISAEGSFEGLLSPYGNVDAGGDLVEAGAYTKTLKEQGPTRPMLWQHKTDCPIGELTLEDRPDGLWCKGQLLMALPEAQKAYLLIKARIVKGLSIGFETIKDAVESGVRRVKEIKLYEGSIVTFPMNETALITSVKEKKPKGQETKGDFNEELGKVQLRDADWQMRSALGNALSSLFYSGFTKEEIISTAETVLQQFSDTYLSYLPAYIDQLSEYYGPIETWSAKRFETKASGKTKRVDSEDLTSDCFLIVGDEKDTSTWKLPWKFSTEEKTQSHLRDALARFGQLDGVSAADKKAAWDKLLKLCKEHGIDVSDEKAAIGTAHSQMSMAAKSIDDARAYSALSAKCLKGVSDSLSPLLDETVDASGESLSRGALEAKEGRTLSAATLKCLQTAQECVSEGLAHADTVHEHLADSAKCAKAAIDTIFPLFDDEAEEDDEAIGSEDEGKSRRPTSRKTAGLKTEPESHSAAPSLIDDIRSLIPVA